MPDTVEASPTKEFFVHMITRDITLLDCVLDLIDNSIDGARRVLGTGRHQTIEPSLDVFRIDVRFDADSFSIGDNCGGINKNDAKHYAFHFGRRPDAPPTGESIGFYGIGMKRAIFKIGRNCVVKSITRDDAFQVDINVEEWLNRENKGDWDFELKELVRDVDATQGTEVTVVNLNRLAAEELSDAAFHSRLDRTISRDYAIYLSNGLKIVINGTPVKPYIMSLLEGGGFEPLKVTEIDAKTGVKYVVVAGISKPLPEDDEPEERRFVETEYYGWYVACNDRVVLAANKGPETVWGHEGFQVWHSQYNGFVGIITFYSEDPKALPWTTTKRDVERDDPLYRRAVVKMKDVTNDFIRYTNLRKEALDKAKAIEKETPRIPVSALPERPTLRMPTLVKSRVDTVNVQYRKTRAEIKRAAAAFGNPRMSASTVGSKTFDYFLEAEGG